jgi:hypothetical protein
MSGMAKVLVHNVTFDCRDPFTLATWWAEMTGGKVAEGDQPGDEEVLVEGLGIPVLFVAVPEPKTVKNRVHLDLIPEGRTRDEEVVRVLGLGAVQVADMRRPDGGGWVWFTDPEGNDFCVVRSEAERGG